MQTQAIVGLIVTILSLGLMWGCSASPKQVGRTVNTGPIIAVSPNPACIGQTITISARSPAEGQGVQGPNTTIWLQQGVTGPYPADNAVELTKAVNTSSGYSYSFVLRSTMGPDQLGKTLTIAPDTTYGLIFRDSRVTQIGSLRVVATCP